MPEINSGFMTVCHLVVIVFGELLLIGKLTTQGSSVESKNNRNNQGRAENVRR